jgi:hypothetical protein
MIRDFTILLLTVCFAIHAQDSQVTAQEFTRFSIPTELVYRFPVTGWRFSKRDAAEFAEEDYDDSNWPEIEVNKPFILQEGIPRIAHGVYVWYRKSFDLHEDPSSSNLVLKLGFISAGDTVFINGVHRAGTRHRGATVKNRDYWCLTPESWFKPGRNVIAIRVCVSNQYGMYDGVPELRKAVMPPVLGSFSHRLKSAPLSRYLSLNTEMNDFIPGEEIAVAAKFASFQDEANGDCEFLLKLSTRTLVNVAMSLQQGQWVQSQPSFFIAPTTPGQYKALAILTKNSKVLWQQETRFTVSPPQKFFIPVDKSLESTGADDFFQIGDNSFGGLGPRTAKLAERGYMLIQQNSNDIRGGSSVCVGINPALQGPCLIASHTRAVPGEWKLSDWSSALGSNYDGLIDAWPYGIIRPVKKQASCTVIPQAPTWTASEYDFVYPENKKVNVRISYLTPANRFQSNLEQIELFAQYPSWRIGGPSAILTADGEVWKSQDEVSQFPENWLLIDFSDSFGRVEFSTPYLLVFQYKPDKLAIADGHLLLKQNIRQGYIWLMPLYGVTLQKPGALGNDALRRCRFWARAVQLAPESLTRSAKVDWTAGAIFIKDSFQRPSLTDDWDTQFIKLSPVPPSFAFSSAAQISILASSPSTDTDYATLAGPYLAVEDSDVITYKITGLLKYIEQTMVSRPRPQNDEVQKLAGRLNELLLQILPIWEEHPWQELQRRPLVGDLQPEVSLLLQTLPLLDENVAARLRKALTDGIPTILNDELQIVNREKKPATINLHVLNPYSGKVLSTPERHGLNGAIDGPCWEGLRLYMLWDCQRSLGVSNLFQDNREAISRYYNLLVNSFDWRYSISWDCYSGLRVGNGLQESTIFHAAFAAVSRMAASAEEARWRDEAAVYSALHLVGIRPCTTPVTNSWLRRYRPWLPEHSAADLIERSEQNLPNHHLEFNDRGGFHHFIMSADTSIHSHVWIMTMLPEIMRPFKEFWGEHTDIHYRPVFPEGRKFEQPPPVGVYAYMTPNPPVSLQESWRERSNMKLRRPLTEIADILSYLDAKYGYDFK